MRFTGLSFALFLLTACGASGDDAATAPSDDGSGGGAASQPDGSVQSGGTTKPATGGSSGTGGSTKPATGGSSGTGGATKPATGGSTGTGGATKPATGGSTGTGGTSATGGSTGTGGTSATGGSTGTGGTTATGGSTGTGGTVPTDGGPGPALVPGVWTNITASIIPATSNTYCVTVDPTNPSTIYFCAPNPTVSLGGIIKSTDGGSTWTKLPTIDTPLHVLVDPNDSNHLYAVDGVWGSTPGFWLSHDGGASWTQPAGFVSACLGSVGTRDTYDIATDPSDFTHILVSFHSPWANGVGPGVLESKDGGNSWTARLAGVNGGYGHAIHFLHDPALGLGDGNTWLLTTQGAGFWRTTDGGTSWAKVSDGAITHGGNFVCYSSKGVLYSGGYQYPSRSTDNGATWSLLSSSGLPYSWYMGALCDGKNLWVQPTGGGTFFVSPDADGLTWTAYKNGTQTGFASGMFWGAFDAKNRILYSAPGGSNIHELWALKLEQ
jgi:hypothetical protein